MGGTTTDMDEDNGISFPNDIRPNTTVLLRTTIFNNTGNDAYLTGWIDWNGDQDFDDPGEQIANETFSYAMFNGNYEVSLIVNVPADAVIGQNISARFRLSTDPIIIASPCGVSQCALDGEIEDYLIQVDCPPDICLPPTISIIRK